MVRKECHAAFYRVKIKGKYPRSTHTQMQFFENGLWLLERRYNGGEGEVVFWVWDKSMWEVIQMKGRWLQICEKLMKYKIENGIWAKAKGKFTAL